MLDVHTYLNKAYRLLKTRLCRSFVTIVLAQSMRLSGEVKREANLGLCHNDTFSFPSIHFPVLELAKAIESFLS